MFRFLGRSRCIRFIVSLILMLILMLTLVLMLLLMLMLVLVLLLLLLLLLLILTFISSASIRPIESLNPTVMSNAIRLVIRDKGTWA